MLLLGLRCTMLVHFTFAFARLKPQDPSCSHQEAVTDCICEALSIAGLEDLKREKQIVCQVAGWLDEF